MRHKYHLPVILGFLVVECVSTARGLAADLEPIRVADDQKSFVLATSGSRFVPWGFNYDHDRTGRLIEDYWDDEWASIEEDFREMKQLGANVVRIHLQFGKFMETPDRPNQHSLDQLGRLVKLAEQTGLYLDLTGLGCYHKQDVPEWYDSLGTRERWTAQARFWEAIAKQCAGSPALFCYDLMNEPVVAGGKTKRRDWLGPAFADKHFVQFITLEQQDQPRPQVARQWIRQLSAAIRKHDRSHMITVGLVPWSLNRKGMQSGFVPEAIIDDLDFIAVHLYPEQGKLDEAIETLQGFSVGKPIVIEETFPLKCAPPEFEKFLVHSKAHANGWIGFYWGKTPAEYDNPKSIPEAVTREWLKTFQRRTRDFRYNSR